MKKLGGEERVEKKDEAKLDMSKNLLIPAILLHLKKIQTHGYDLMHEITKFGIETVDKGYFYRTLRQLEKDNIVTSTWDTSSSGPAKRIYALTEIGENQLKLWAKTLDTHQKMVHQFLDLYNPFIYPTHSSNGEDK